MDNLASNSASASAPKRLLSEHSEAEHWTGRFFIGEWRDAPATIEVRNPATGKVLGSVGIPSLADIDHAVRAALVAQKAWENTRPIERSLVMQRAADLFTEHRDEIASWLVAETGSIRPKAYYEVDSAVAESRAAGSLNFRESGAVMDSTGSRRLSIARRVPVGLVAVITPWNVPLALAMRSLAPALALGNAVLLKPDPQTPISGGVVLARIFHEAGLPEGLLAVLPGGADIGEILVTTPDVRMVTFTGSTRAGRQVGALAGKALKRVALELGGKNAMIVLDDADLKTAVSCGAFGSFHHQGQICMATGRHIVHQAVAADYARALAKKARSMPVGDPAEGDVALGPIINQSQIARIDDLVKQSVARGATLLEGGRREGPYYHPTVLADVLPGMPAFEEEIFGPVAAVVTARDDQHAIELANMTSYGLSGAVISRSFDRAYSLARQMKVGMVHINEQTINDEAQIPMGGRGQSGNGSRFGTVNNIEEFTEYQWMTVGGAPPKY